MIIYMFALLGELYMVNSSDRQNGPQNWPSGSPILLNDILPTKEASDLLCQGRVDPFQIIKCMSSCFSFYFIG